MVEVEIRSTLLLCLNYAHFHNHLMKSDKTIKASGICFEQEGMYWILQLGYYRFELRLFHPDTDPKSNQLEEKGK